MRFEEEEEQEVCVDLERIMNTITHQKVTRCKNASILGKLMIMAINVLHSSLWHPELTTKHAVVQAMRRVDEALHHHTHLQHQLVRLKEERSEFATLKDLIGKDKEYLEEQMHDLTMDLCKRKEQYKEAQQLRLPTDMFRSNVSLLLSTYDRYSKTYFLYNDMINVINKTLSDTDITEKMAHFCGTVNKVDAFQFNSFRCFEDTMQKMMRDIALCDETKEDIRTRLSLAGSPDFRLAVELGSEVEEAQAMSRADTFLQTGDIILGRSCQTHPTSSSSLVPSSTSTACT